MGGGELDKLEDGGGGLNFTPYQQSHIGMTKYSASQPHSNPMMTGGSSSIEAEKSSGIGGISGPDLPAKPKKEQQLAVNNVKKVWGTQMEETKSTPVA